MPVGAVPLQESGNNMRDPNLPTEQGALSEIRALPEALLGGSDAEVAHILRARCLPFPGHLLEPPRSADLPSPGRRAERQMAAAKKGRMIAADRHRTKRSSKLRSWTETLGTKPFNAATARKVKAAQRSART